MNPVLARARACGTRLFSPKTWSYERCLGMPSFSLARMVLWYPNDMPHHCPYYSQSWTGEMGARRSSLSRMPTGFCPIAQGCAHRATLGNDRINTPTPTGLCPDERRALLQNIERNGMNERHGIEVELKQEGHNPVGPVGVDHSTGPFPRVARSAQSWAVVRNPVGILRQMQGKPTGEYFAPPNFGVMPKLHACLCTLIFSPA